MRKPAVAVIGSVTIDRIVRGRESFHQLGGVTTYAGITFQRLGIHTSVVTNLAHGHQSILDALRKEDVEVISGRCENTTCFINHIRSNDRWQEMPAAADPITCEQMKSVLIPETHLHLGPLHPDDLDARIVQSISNSNRLVSLDVQGYLRAVEDNRVQTRVAEYLADALLCAKIVKAEEKELTAILDFFGMTLPVWMQTYGIDEIVVTAGPRGGFIRTLSEQEFHFGAQALHSSDQALAVGAGDVFFAAYLTYRFYEGETIPVSSQRAACLAARQIQGQYITRETLKLKTSAPSVSTP